MAVTIAIETPLQDDVRVLVARLNDHLLPLSPLEFQFKMTVEQMAGSDTTLFVARDETGTAVGMGALKVHSPALGEVKRMFTDPAVRGKRIGRLARIRIEESEVESYQSELNAILGFVEQLNEVNVEGVEPMTSVTPMTLRRRDDVISDGSYADKIVSNAPLTEDNFFMVPKVVE